MYRILFLCHGNICRSPMAECIFQDLLNRRGLADRFCADSAAVSSEETGSPIYPPARRTLLAHGVLLTEHRARTMRREDYGRWDLLVGMDESNLRNIRRIAGGDPLGKVRRLLDGTDRPRDVADPWYTGDFEAAYADIDAGCRALLEALAGGAPRRS